MISGIGLDLVEVGRIRVIIKRYGKRFIKRIFTDNEIDYCSKKSTPYIHYAARFAVKEAFAKAIGTGISQGIRFRDIEAINDISGKPEIITHGKTRELIKFLGVNNIFLTITHTKDISAAVVVIETLK